MQLSFVPLVLLLLLLACIEIQGLMCRNTALGRLMYTAPQFPSLIESDIAML